MFLCHYCDIDSSLSWLRGTAEWGWYHRQTQFGKRVWPLDLVKAYMYLFTTYLGQHRAQAEPAPSQTWMQGMTIDAPMSHAHSTCAVASAGMIVPATSLVHYVVKSWLAPVCRLFPLSHCTCFLGCQKRGLSWGISLGVVSPSNSAQQLMWAVRCIENIVWHFFTASATN